VTCAPVPTRHMISFLLLFRGRTALPCRHWPFRDGTCNACETQSQSIVCQLPPTTTCYAAIASTSFQPLRLQAAGR
jgi:hypothetical protein